MKIETDYNIGDDVWDTLTLRKVKIIGVSVLIGQTCCDTIAKSTTVYYVDNHTCGTFRKPEELIRV